MEAELRATRGSGAIILKPQTRYFSDPPTETNEAAIETFWNGQLYTVVGKPDPSGRLAVAAVVEAVRDPDLARRCADRAWAERLALSGRLWRMRRRRESGAEWRKERYA